MMIRSEKTRLLKEIGCKIGCEILLLSGSKALSQVGGGGYIKTFPRPEGRKIPGRLAYRSVGGTNYEISSFLYIYIHVTRTLIFYKR